MNLSFYSGSVNLYLLCVTAVNESTMGNPAGGTQMSLPERSGAARSRPYFRLSSVLYPRYLVSMGSFLLGEMKAQLIVSGIQTPSSHPRLND